MWGSTVWQSRIFQTCQYIQGFRSEATSSLLLSVMHIKTIIFSTFPLKTLKILKKLTENDHPLEGIKIFTYKMAERWAGNGQKVLNLQTTWKSLVGVWWKFGNNDHSGARIKIFTWTILGLRMGQRVILSNHQTNNLLKPRVKFEWRPLRDFYQRIWTGQIKQRGPWGLETLTWLYM